MDGERHTHFFPERDTVLSKGSHIRKMDGMTSIARKSGTLYTYMIELVLVQHALGSVHV